MPFLALPSQTLDLACLVLAETPLDDLGIRDERGAHVRGVEPEHAREREQMLAG